MIENPTDAETAKPAVPEEPPRKHRIKAEPQSDEDYDPPSEAEEARV